ncbi:MAG: zinc ribbon domain-containing protein [Nitrospinota bacterium]|nr:zinc ribbon domain-containing protein [Nitrospinota bacterium]
MPIYEYGCPKCEREFEVLHGISDNSARKCPECGAKMKKLISLGSFHLKGGGWYKDGYGSSGSSGESAKSTSTSSAATGGSETTTSSGDSKKEKGKSKGTKAA